jgi:hypothetical protein
MSERQRPAYLTVHRKRTRPVYDVDGSPLADSVVKAAALLGVKTRWLHAISEPYADGRRLLRRPGGRGGKPVYAPDGTTVIAPTVAAAVVSLRVALTTLLRISEPYADGRRLLRMPHTPNGGVRAQIEAHLRADAAAGRWTPQRVLAEQYGTTEAYASRIRLELREAEDLPRKGALRKEAA